MQTPTESSLKRGLVNAAQWVTVARLIRPRGLKGELLADILTDFPERFSERRRLYLRGAPSSCPREVLLEAHWVHQGRLVLKFEGVDSMSEADALRDYDVVIPRAERAPLEAGAVYIGDLVGCLLYDRASACEVGEIVAVDRESTNMELLVVRAVRGEVLIPFAKAYQPQIDLAARRMEMTLPEGLLSLGDEPRAAEKRRTSRRPAVPTLPGESVPAPQGSLPGSGRGSGEPKKHG